MLKKYRSSLFRYFYVVFYIQAEPITKKPFFIYLCFLNQKLYK